MLTRLRFSTYVGYYKRLSPLRLTDLNEMHLNKPSESHLSLVSIRVRILQKPVSQPGIIRRCFGDSPSSSSKVDSSRHAAMNSPTTRYLRFGLAAHAIIRGTSQEGHVFVTHLDVRFMSSTLRLASLLSTTIWVNLGSSSLAIRPPLEVIRVATFSSLRICLRQ